MSLTNIQIEVLQRRKNAAKSALKFFKNIKSIKSTNNPFAFTTKEDDDNLDYYRSDPNTDNSIVQSFEDAAFFQVGNCDEKGRICYSSLVSNPLIAPPHSYVTLIEAIDYDHVFVIVADFGVTGRSTLKALPQTTMIVDGWTEDWYFPQLSWTTAKWYGFSNIPNPRQLYVRTQIERHDFMRYGGARGMVREIGGQGVVYNV
jgi:hypothetical protein